MTYGDHNLTYRTAISIAQIPIFFLSLLIAYYFRRTHRIGCFCIGIFSIIRLVSASCLLALINENKYSTKATVFVCESLGIVLFVFIFVEVLGWVNKQTHTFHKYFFLVPQLLTYVDIVIAIIGYIVVKNKDDPYAPTPYSQTSRALLVAMYVYVLGLLGVLTYHCDRCVTGKAQRCALMGVALCVPFMVIRLMYSLIFEATGDMRFNAVKGDPTTYLFMTFLPEAIVVFFCIALIWKIPVNPGRESIDEEEGRKISDTLARSQIEA